ncbi:unnamed protein product [Sphagnum compactum]
MNLGAILRGLHKGAASRSWGRVWWRSWWEYEERGFHGTSEASDITLVSQTLKIASLVDAFRSRGHFVASLDPLGRTLGPLVEGNDSVEYSEPVNAKDLFELLKNYPTLNLEAVGLKGVDPDRRYFLGDHLRISRATQLFWTVNEVVALLRGSYCGTTTVEHEHVVSQPAKDWIRLMVERPQAHSLFPPPYQQRILHHLLYTDYFERFLAKKFQASKRFGIEGCESLIPGLFALIERAAETGVEAIELGMSHRGRLNVLHTLLSKPLGSIVTEFKSGGDHQYLRVGDVKYHLGTRGTLFFGDKSVQISLSPNPSHLEAVDPVVLGKTRAKQFFKQDHSRQQNMGLLLHGDAAFSGLGLAAEVMQLSDLPEYTTGGTIHVIINNQIGFTTDPKLARSSPHPSDVAKGVGAPIFHCNGDDPEGVVQCCRLAVDWRQRFQRDVVVDLVCYRRHGHNEQDDPRVTQPLTYQKILNHPTTLQIYSQKLLNEDIISQDIIDRWASEVETRFETEYVAADSSAPTLHEWLASNWQGEALGSSSSKRYVQPTGVDLETLQKVGRAISTPPPGFNLHPDVASLLKARWQMMESGVGIDWAMAEALAFGSLLLHADPTKGQTVEQNRHFSVRLSGQDCERGTFNQRHSVLYDQTTARRYIPLNNVWLGHQAQFLVCNSNLSEAAVLGFEYGFSLENENSLIIWEAQFGDFTNNAQSIIDNFIASGEEKWMTPTGLVLLLPHGYDGQGPEHSSGRLERFLQLCNDDPDHLPGFGPLHKHQIEAGFTAADKDGKGYLTKADLKAVIEPMKGINAERAEILMQELDIGQADQIQRQDWDMFMAQWMRRNAEKDHNLCVANITTPANFFHVLRRQMNRPYSKPLVIMSPKYLLHHKPCVSKLADMVTGTYFRRVIADGDPADNLRNTHDLLPRKDARRLLICSGKIFYLLSNGRRSRKVRDIAIVRLEQIAPFPFDRLAMVINRYPKAQLVWVQEEPKNMGAWTYVQPRLATAVRELCSHREFTEIHFIGRATSATTATGSFQVHQQETRAIIDSAFSP